MFYSIREEGFNTHTVWREENKIAENLSFQECFEVLASQMLDYDTMQVKLTNGSWLGDVWSGVNVKEHYQYLLDLEKPRDIMW